MPDQCWFIMVRVNAGSLPRKNSKRQADKNESVLPARLDGVDGNAQLLIRQPHRPAQKLRVENRR